MDMTSSQPSDSLSTLEVERVLLEVFEATADAGGEAFFHSLARCLAAALGMRCALVAELDPGALRARTLALWDRGAHHPPHEYGLCEKARAQLASRAVCVCESDVAARFPEASRAWPRFSPQSLIGIPIHDSHVSRGHILVLDDAPIRMPLHRAWRLRALGVRAGVELARLDGSTTTGCGAAVTRGSGFASSRGLNW
jgi:hypothetical protein